MGGKRWRLSTNRGGIEDKDEAFERVIHFNEYDGCPIV